LTAITLAISQPTTMSSRAIADLVEKRHDNVKRTIDTLIEQGVIVQPQFEDEQSNDAMGRPRITQVYHLDKRSSLIVVAQLCPEFTARIVDRWQQLEEQAAIGFAIPQNLPDALRLAADLADENAKLKAQLDAKPLQINNTTSLRAADLLTKTVRAFRDGGMPKPVALGLALDEVHRQTGVRMLPDYEQHKHPSPNTIMAKMIRTIKRSRTFAKTEKNANWAKVLRMGYMPHSMLLKYMHLNIADLKLLIDKAVSDGVVTSTTGTEYGFNGIVYSMVGEVA